MSKKYFIILIGILFFYINGNAQKFPTTQAELDSVYAKNIKLSKINGTYIPRNLDDAHRRLNKLTPDDAVEKFKNAPDGETVSRKLHFGIGRWMIVNWSFEEGSRLSHFLKGKGLLHPDDMAQFILRTYYRKLNELSENDQVIIDQLAVERKKEAQKLFDKK